MRPWQMNSHGMTMGWPAPEWSEELGSASPAVFELLCVRYSCLYFACNILNKADIITIFILWGNNTDTVGGWMHCWSLSGKRGRPDLSGCKERTFLYFIIYLFMYYIIVYTSIGSLDWLANSRKCYENSERRKSWFTIARNKDFLKDWKVDYVII